MNLIYFAFKYRYRFKDLNNLINKINFCETALIYFTSGSTGEPKGIKLSYENILYCLYEQLKRIYKGSRNLSFGVYAREKFS